MKLADLQNIQYMEFDIPNRILHVSHTGDNEQIFKQLDTLKFDTSIVSTDIVENDVVGNQISERKVLWAVLIINFAFFAIEIVFGLLSKSMGLVADSLDMLADSLIYGLALIAVGGTMLRKKKVARFAGIFQLILGAIGFIEVMRRIISEEQMPAFEIMISVSIFALIANSICLYLLQKNKSKEAHMQASMIFTSTDVITNSGVIVAGILVHFLNTNVPDLVIGTIIFAFVIRGAYKIWQLSK
jgi:Co/Zn/Cd efflux system component